MKLLLDEQIPRKLTKAFPSSFEVWTVKQRGWSSIKNGELLRLASESNFTALITTDKNMTYQQNHATLPLAVIVLNAYRNRAADLQPFVSPTVELLSAGLEPGFYLVKL